MQYFLVYQEGPKDGDPQFDGPYKSISIAKTVAEQDYNYASGDVFTILGQSGTTFTQIAQAAIPPAALNWK